jgi:hypothetical protein
MRLLFIGWLWWITHFLPEAGKWQFLSGPSVSALYFTYLSKAFTSLAFSSLVSCCTAQRLNSEMHWQKQTNAILHGELCYHGLAQEKKIPTTVMVNTAKRGMHSELADEMQRNEFNLSVPMEGAVTSQLPSFGQWFISSKSSVIKIILCARNSLVSYFHLLLLKFK